MKLSETTLARLSVDEISRMWGADAYGAIHATIERGSRSYVRAIHLPRLFPLMDLDKIADVSEEGNRRVCEMLEAALQGQQAMMKHAANHYDMNRHLALKQAYMAETGRVS